MAPVQGKVYVLMGDGGNITVQVGTDGVMLVDTGFRRSPPRPWPRSEDYPTTGSLDRRHARP